MRHHNDGVDEWTDADFVPRGPDVESVEELLESVRARYRQLDLQDDPRDDPTIVEKLRLLICVRSVQRWSAREVLSRKPYRVA